MIALDTNIVLRYLRDDDPRQSAAARRLIDDECSPSTPAFLSTIVIAEVGWTLRRLLKIPREGIPAGIRGLLDHPNLRIEHRDAVSMAVESYALGQADFGDYLIAAIGIANGAKPVTTFDVKAGAETGFKLQPC